MGLRSRILFDQETFAADTNLVNIPADNVKYLQIGLGLLQNGSTAPTLANMIGNFDEVIATLGGHQICKIRMDDLIAYNLLWLDNWPWFHLAGTDNYLGGLGGIKLPLYVTKNGRSLMTQTTYGTATSGADAVTLSEEYQYTNSPFPLHFAYQYQSLAGAVNARWTGMQRAGAALQGILVYQPWTSVDDDPALPEIAKLSMFIDDREVYAANLFTMKHHRFCDNSVDSTATYGDKYDTNVNYTYIDFSQEPWRADKIIVTTSNACGAYNSGATGTARLIGVYSEA